MRKVTLVLLLTLLTFPSNTSWHSLSFDTQLQQEITLALFPGTEPTAAQLETRLESLGYEVLLICTFDSAILVIQLGSQCTQSVTFAALSASVVGNQVDFFLFGAFTSERVGQLKGLLVDEKAGAVGVGDLLKIHIATIPETGIRSLQDLDDARNSTDREGTLTDFHAHDVFRAEDLSRALRDHAHYPRDEQPDLLLSGEIDAFFETSRVPSDNVAAVANQDELILIAIPEETVDKMNDLDEEEDPYIKDEIDASIYEREAEASIPTAAVAEVTAATGKPSAELVEAVTRLLLEEPFIAEDSLVRALTWLKEQKIPIHPVAKPIIDEFLQERTAE